MAQSLAILTRHQQIAANEANKDKTGSKMMNMTRKPMPSDIQFELDAYKRPIQKIALLCGSPGAGVCFYLDKPRWSLNYCCLENDFSTCRSKTCRI